MSLTAPPAAQNPPPATAVTQRGSDYAELSRRVAKAGLMRRRGSRYVVRIIATVGLFLAAWVGMGVLGDSWWQLGIAGAIGLLSTQLGFLGHDAGHRQIFRTRQGAERFSLLIGNLGIGLGYGWWMDKHTRHHANPNHEDKDPDVAPGVVRWTQSQALTARAAQKVVTKVQAFVFIPLLLLEGLNLHVASVRAAIKGDMRRPLLEGGLLAVNMVANLVLPFVFMSPGKAVLFLAIQQGVFGLYMGLSFAPNHKGMPVLTADDNLDYLRRQVITSRNVTGGPFTDLALGGLNYQIEHHLFPSMPRFNLRRAQPIVRDYCAELGVPYVQESAVVSYTMALKALHEVGSPLRGPISAEG